MVEGARMVESAAPQVNIASNSIETMMDARVILNAAGEPETLIFTGAHGAEIKYPGFAYPFVKSGNKVLVVLTVVQVSIPEPTLAPKLLIPGAR